MDDGPSNIKVTPDHFQVSTTQSNNPSASQQGTDNSLRIGPIAHFGLRKLRSAGFIMNLFSLPRLPWSSGSDRQEKVQLTAAELGSLRSELADLEERAAHLKARLEHIDEILLSARLSGYLYIRTRWAALPGEPPPIDDTEVDDWLPRFVVLHGICVFFFLISTDLSPQDSALLSDIVEVGSMPSFTREDEGTRYCFYIMTRHGLRYECSHNSKVQVDSWLSALQSDCNLGSDGKVSNDGSSVEN